MADFSEELQNLRPSFPLTDIVDHQSNIIEPIHQFTEINQLPVHHNFPPHTFIPSFSTNNDNFFIHQQGPEFPGNLAENFPAIFHHNNNNNQYPPIPICQVSATPGNGIEFQESCRKRKAIILDNSESSSMNSSPQDSDVVIKTKNNSRRGKRAKGSEEAEKPKEVVHVRARRGQATDSHSLAERVRRGKINERLRCLQDIVPGCYKTMGMAVMLDEIINYVQSLQNQVEFLSMKLTAASTFYDFNSETDAIETMQRAKAKEAKELERTMRGEGYGELSCYNSTWSL